ATSRSPDIWRYQLRRLQVDFGPFFPRQFPPIPRKTQHDMFVLNEIQVTLHVPNSPGACDTGTVSFDKEHHRSHYTLEKERPTCQNCSRRHRDRWLSKLCHSLGAQG